MSERPDGEGVVGAVDLPPHEDETNESNVA